MSPLLASELRRVLAYPQLHGQIDEAGAVAVLGWLEAGANKVDDPTEYRLSIGRATLPTTTFSRRPLPLMPSWRAATMTCSS